MRYLMPLCMLMLAGTASAAVKRVAVTVSNTSSVARTDAPVVVNLKEVRGLKFTPTSAVVTLDGKEIASQLDDMDGDYRMDELAFLTNIGVGEKQTFSITLSDEAQQRDYPARVYAHMGLNDKYGKYPEISSISAPGDSYIFKDVYPHGAEVESELTAYRIYVDNRQNIDLYGKRHQQLELQKTNFYSVAEDIANGYGNDVLWAGQSMGCGTLREFVGGSPVLIDDVATRAQRLVSKGPLRTVVEMKDIQWRGNNVTTYYILYAGHREMEVRVEADRPLHGLQLCTGVQKVLNNATGMVRPDGIACSWGSDYPDYGKKDVYVEQAVGMAVSVPQQYVKTTAKDSLQYMVVLDSEGRTSLSYHVTFCADIEQWEGAYHSAEAWFASLDAWRETLAPLKISVK